MGTEGLPLSGSFWTPRPSGTGGAKHVALLLPGWVRANLTQAVLRASLAEDVARASSESRLRTRVMRRAQASRSVGATATHHRIAVTRAATRSKNGTTRARRACRRPSRTRPRCAAAFEHV